MTFPPYDPEAACRMCGRTPVGTRACEWVTPGHSLFGMFSHNPSWVYVVGGHLHRKCGRCDHEWIELALNAREMTEEEAAALYDQWKKVQQEIDRRQKEHLSAQLREDAR